MTKLNQINALAKGRKSETEKAVDGLYKLLQTAEIFDGRVRTYQPKDEDGDKLPQEQQVVQQKAEDLLTTAVDKWTNLWDLVLTQDTGNQSAKADIEVIIQNTSTTRVLAKDVPVTTLLFLEKQVNDLETFITKLPVPCTTRKWDYDPQVDMLKSNPVSTSRSKKVPKAFVKYDATDKHPAQVETFQEDIFVGTWTEIQFSGRMTAKRKNELLSRVRILKDALKLARERANSTTVEGKPKIAKGLLDYVLGN